MARPIYRNMTFQVLTAVAIGAAIGIYCPHTGQNLKILADIFLRLIKMVVAPIIFLTVVGGIYSMGDMRRVGRVGLKALLYFEIVTTIALAIGLLVANGIRPGAGITPPSGDDRVQKYVDAAHKQALGQAMVNIIPENIVHAFAEGDLLQILFFAVLFGIAAAALGPRLSGLMEQLESLTALMFRLVAIIVKFAPFGALGAMAATTGTYGPEALKRLLLLMVCVYLTMAIFIFGVLLAISCIFRFSLFGYLRFIAAEIVLVLGTSSSESALPRMMQKLELMGCGRGVVRMAIPTGYSFNLDGTSIYLSMAVLFIAQAFGIHLGIGEQISIMALLMLTSKGAAAVTGGGFVTLAATISATRLPVEGLALLFGVDRFMSEARAITNLIGNGIATIVVSKWEGDFDQAVYQAAMAGPVPDLQTLNPQPELR